MKLKITVVDPWCRNGLEEYIYSFINSLINSNNFDRIQLITSHASEYSDPFKIQKKIFFLFSDGIRFNFLRKPIRVIEYSITMIWLSISNKSNIVHFQWMLFPVIDFIAIKILKLRGKKVFYTAHNSKPHNKRISNSMIENYKIIDKIFVHGFEIKNEIIDFSKSIDKEKIIILPHPIKEEGKNLLFQKPIEIKDEFIRNYNKYFVFIGNVLKNKGVDKLIEIWNEIYEVEKSDCLLIIAGKFSNDLKFIKKLKKENDYIIIIDRFLKKSEFNWVLKKSNLVLLPYRNGSVSGVLFSAANFKKPVLTTTFGSIQEYIINNKTGFISSDFEEFKRYLKILLKQSSNYLSEIGIKNKNHIYDICGEKNITSIIKNNFS